MKIIDKVKKAFGVETKSTIQKEISRDFKYFNDILNKDMKIFENKISDLKFSDVVMSKTEINNFHTLVEEENKQLMNEIKKTIEFKLNSAKNSKK